MAKIKRRKLRWKPSASPQVIGYKLYWSEDGEVDYGSSCAKLGNVTEVVLPDGVDGFKPGSGPLELGITAVDELGNESDFITLTAPYQFNAPQAPEDLLIETVEEADVAEDEPETDAYPPEETDEEQAPIRLYEGRNPPLHPMHQGPTRQAGHSPVTATGASGISRKWDERPS